MTFIEMGEWDDIENWNPETVITYNDDFIKADCINFFILLCIFNIKGNKIINFMLQFFFFF